MTRSICAPCCQPSESSRSLETYRMASLIILCNTLEQLVGAPDQEFTSCKPCCAPNNWTRNEETYRQARLIVLCAINAFYHP